MGRKSLVEILEERNASVERDGTDWGAVRGEWIGALEALGRDIGRWVRPAVKKGLLELRKRTVQLHEEHLGRYEAPAWDLQVRTRTISIEPVGREIVGGGGRVDMVLGARVAFLIREPDGRWLVHASSSADAMRTLSGEQFAAAVDYLLA